MLRLEDEWVWDSWYLREGGRWHCWYLKAPRSIGDPELRHWNVSLGHATSDDLVNWSGHSTALAPAAGPAWDDFTTWTGSTLRGEDGRWHLFYTGTSRAEDGAIQRIGHAVGDDLECWERVGSGPCLDLCGPNAEFYEIDHAGRWHDRAMRDPWVMKDPCGPGYLMYFTARVPQGDEVNDAGCIGLARSPDLNDWMLEPPTFAGGWGQLEVPQVFEHRSRWYCLFCMAEEHQAGWNRKANGPSGTGSHYLISDHPRGPWRIPDGPALDIDQDRYAARIVDDGGLKILGFKDGGRDSFGGYIMDPAAVHCRADGTLCLER